MKKTISILLTMAIVSFLTLSVFTDVTAEDVEMTGYIGTTDDVSIGEPGAGGDYDITMPTEVYWWVTQAAPAEVVNGDAEGPDDNVKNTIKNNRVNTEIEVSFESFTLDNADAEALASGLTLYLTGDLALPLGEDNDYINLSSGYSDAAIRYTTMLTSDAVWEYGFAGGYPAVLTAQYEPQYSMVLGFKYQ